MRIERIELENWMSYPRRWTDPNSQGKEEEVTPVIDLSAQPLTLIAGENGAGKSAILEAICYALFAHYPRGNNRDAIRSGEKKAKVRMYFNLPSAEGDTTYCVERLLSRSPGGTSATLKQIEDDGSEITLVTGQSAVTSHIEEKLLRGVKYDAFESTVFLRQEAAGKFMGLSHADQREQLLRLCRLEIYEKIHERAQQHRRDLDIEINNLRKQFGELEYATKEHLSARRECAQEMQDNRDTLRIEEEAAKQLLAGVKRAASLEHDIDERTQKLKEWSHILEQAEKIRHAHQWKTVWERLESTLTQARQIHESVSSRASEIKQVEHSFEIARAKVDQLADEHSTLEVEYRQQSQTLDKIRDGLVALVQEKESANRELKNTREAKRLDEEISRIRQKQTEREAQLANFDEVERKCGYSRLLTQAQSALQYVLDKLGNAEAEQQTAEDSGIEAQEASQTSSQLQETVAQKRATLHELEEKEGRLRQKQEQLRRLQAKSQDIIANRNKAIEAGVCPTCGTEIVGDVSEHVHSEVKEHQTEIAALGEEIQGIETELSTIQVEAASLEDEAAAQENRAKELKTQAEYAEVAAKAARQRAATSRQQAGEQWGRHIAIWIEVPPPGWLMTPSAEALETIKQELGNLVDIETEYQKLTGIRASFQSEAETLQLNEVRRAELIIASPVSETQLTSLEKMFKDAGERLTVETDKRREFAENVGALKSQLAELEGELESARRQQSDVDRGLNDLKASQKNDQEHLSGVSSTLQAEQQRIESQYPDLAGDLLRAVDNPDTFMGLKELADMYSRKASQIDELERAEADATKVETEISLKQEELDDLLMEIGEVSEAEASQRVERIQDDLSSIEQELVDVIREIANIERDHEQRQAIRLQLRQLETERRAYKTIEEAIFPGTKTKPPGELFAYITQKLMDSIRQEASRILDSLGWHMEIGYSEKDGFSIKDQALSAVRKYDEFSGGERFAIAIAVALAIGRVTHGAGNIRCLFIDEGFGTLDAKHRKRIITDAIGKLIEIGSRDQVVVITHLKDMQAHFPNRIELKNEDDRSALVSPTEEMLEWQP